LETFTPFSCEGDQLLQMWTIRLKCFVLVVAISLNALVCLAYLHTSPSRIKGVPSVRLLSHEVSSSPSSEKDSLVSSFNSLISFTKVLVPAITVAVALKSSPAAAETEVIPTKGFQTRSGLKYFNIIETDKNYPLYGQLISFHYTTYYRPKNTGKLETLDSSHNINEPFLQKHGNGRVISGVDEALHTMGIGAKRRVVVPNSLGFTKFGLGPLPLEPFNRRRLGDVLDLLEKNEGELIFDLELLSVADDENDQGFYDDVPVTQDDVRSLVRKSLESNRPEFYENLETTTPRDLFKK
jgi:hypothetical protein